MTTTDIRPIIERERTVRFWGSERRITPRFVEAILGDGEKLIWVEPMATRPNFFVIRVDSAWDLDGDFYDHLDDVLDAIGDEYGEQDDSDEIAGWPALDASCGESWGEYDLGGTDA